MNSLILFGIRKNFNHSKGSIIVPVHEKTDKTDCNDYLGITLCDVFGRMPSSLGNLKLNTPVVARQPKVKHLHGYILKGSDDGV
jgi:hypothetical protein